LENCLNCWDSFLLLWIFGRLKLHIFVLNEVEFSLKSITINAYQYICNMVEQFRSREGGNIMEAPQEANEAVEDSIQRRTEETGNEAPETRTWMDSGKRAVVGVLDKGTGALASIVGLAWNIGRTLVALSVVVTLEAAKEVKDSIKEDILAPVLKKAGVKIPKAKKEEKGGK